MAFGFVGQATPVEAAPDLGARLGALQELLQQLEGLLAPRRLSRPLRPPSSSALVPGQPPKASETFTPGNATRHHAAEPLGTPVPALPFLTGQQRGRGALPAALTGERPPLRASQERREPKAGACQFWTEARSRSHATPSARSGGSSRTDRPLRTRPSCLPPEGLGCSTRSPRKLP